MPTGVIDEVFFGVHSNIAADDALIASSVLNTQLRTWMLGDLTYWSGDPLDIDSISYAFDRSNIGANYTQSLLSSAGSVGDTASAKVQSNQLGVMERSFRSRHVTPVRALLASAGRRMGHSDASQGILARVVRHAQDLIAAGGNGFEGR